jgi:hypothetical protein
MLGPAEIFTIFFITLGPLKILGPFAQRTYRLDDATVGQIAVRAFLMATISAIPEGSSAQRCLPTGTYRSAPW